MEKYYVTVEIDGTTRWHKNAKCTLLHRIGGPAVVQANGDKWWCVNNNFHREDGPAQECADGSKSWYKNGLTHREDGPAIDNADGYKAWCIDGKYHRTDGPAIEYPDGQKQWYVNGNELSEAEFNARNHPACVDKTITIDGVNYKLTKI